MRLFLQTFWITSKHSSRRLLCLLCVALLCTGVGMGSLSLFAQESHAKASIAIINLDQSPISRIAIRTAAASEGLSELLSLHFIEPHQKDSARYTATVTIPEAFTQSVMNGENNPPLVELSISSPLEAGWVRQMAQAGARYLTSAQQGIYTVQEGVDYGVGMEETAYQRLLADVNITWMQSFLTRLKLVEHRTLSASGGLSLPQYYLVSILSVLLLSYGFLYRSATEQIRSFACQLNSRRKRLVLFGAVWAHVAAWNCMVLLPFYLLSGAALGFTPQGLSALLLFSFLATGFSLVMSLVFSTHPACAAGSILICTAMGLCSGVFVPLALMPPVFEALAPLTVSLHGQRLASVWLGEPLSGRAWGGAAAAALLVTAVAFLLWNKKTKRRRC